MVLGACSLLNYKPDWWDLGFLAAGSVRRRTPASRDRIFPVRFGASRAWIGQGARSPTNPCICREPKRDDLAVVGQNFRRPPRFHQRDPMLPSGKRHGLIMHTL